MLAGKYLAIANYLARGVLPENIPSTVSNFNREARSYTLDGSGELLRSGLKVVKYAERENIYNAMHETLQGYIRSRYYLAEN